MSGRGSLFDAPDLEPLVTDARACAAAEMQRYFSAVPPRDDLPDVPSLAGHIEALCVALIQVESERAAWERHGQEETFARERLERETRKGGQGDA